MTMVQFPELRPENRKRALYNNFVKARRAARIYMKMLAQTNALIRKADRTLKQINESIVSAGQPKTGEEFYNLRFWKNGINDLRAARDNAKLGKKETEAAMASMCAALHMLAAEADELCTFREKCHIMGVSEQHMRMRMRFLSEKEDPIMADLIYTCSGERRTEEDTFDCNEIDMPLWNIMHQGFMWALKHDSATQAVCSEALSEFLAEAADNHLQRSHDRRFLHLVQ